MPIYLPPPSEPSRIMRAVKFLTGLAVLMLCGAVVVFAVLLLGGR